MVNAGAWWWWLWWWSASCYYMSDSYGNHYRSSSRLNTRCNRCRGMGHTSINCLNVVNASRQRVNNIANGGAQNSGVSNVASAYVGGNAAQGRYGSASGQYYYWIWNHISRLSCLIVLGRIRTDDSSCAALEALLMSRLHKLYTEYNNQGLSKETQKALNQYPLIDKDDLYPSHFKANRQFECLEKTANRFRCSSNHQQA
nr:replication protein A 70 kDa DNA-binding subunit A-like [Tanacetum cinerariifolium]